MFEQPRVVSRNDRAEVEPALFANITTMNALQGLGFSIVPINSLGLVQAVEIRYSDPLNSQADIELCGVADSTREPTALASGF